jgi:predicted nucleic acid-binding protein
MQLGFKLYDALHLAFAQSASVDIFLTTDDRLLRKARQYPEVV